MQQGLDLPAVLLAATFRTPHCLRLSTLLLQNQSQKYWVSDVFIFVPYSPVHTLDTHVCSPTPRSHSHVRDHQFPQSLTPTPPHKLSAKALHNSVLSFFSGIVRTIINNDQRSCHSNATTWSLAVVPDSGHDSQQHIAQHCVLQLHLSFVGRRVGCRRVRGSVDASRHRVAACCLFVVRSFVRSSAVRHRPPPSVCCCSKNTD